MKVAENFDLREFIPPVVWNQFGEAAKWFVNPVLFKLAQFEKEFLTAHFKEKDDQVETVLVVINNWHYAKSAIRRWCGLRTVNYILARIKAGKKPARLTQHLGGMCNAYDAIYFIKYKNGKKVRLHADKVRAIILDNESKFMDAGLTTLESAQYAPTWVHHDLRPTGLDHILMVGDKK